MFNELCLKLSCTLGLGVERSATSQIKNLNPLYISYLESLYLPLQHLGAFLKRFLAIFLSLLPLPMRKKKRVEENRKHMHTACH